MLTVSELRNILNYDPETGFFTWRINKGQRGRVGLRAGSLRSDGYGSIKINRHKYKSHRLAWLYMTGEWTRNDIDHINGDKADNRFCNIRDVPEVFNMQNIRTASKHSKTGILGVSQKGKRWWSRITINKIEHYLGTYATKEEAHAAYLSAKRIHHPGCTI